MSRITLSDTGDWKLVDGDQDVRGFSVVDAGGQTVGTVASMILDTDAGLVTSLLLNDGTEVPAADVTIGETVVYLGQASAPAAVAPHAPEPRDPFVDDYRAHHDAALAPQGRRFDDDADAYRYGHDAAHDPAHRNRRYEDAEGDLRSGYAADRDFDADREAVRTGYDRAQNGRGM